MPGGEPVTDGVVRAAQKKRLGTGPSVTGGFVEAGGREAGDELLFR